MEHLLKLSKAITDGDLNIDYNGHCRSGQVGKYADMQLDTLFMGLSSGEDTEQLLNAIASKTPLPRYIYLGKGLRDCFDCGQGLKFECDGRTLRATTRCPFPKGVPPFEFHLNVPSGFLVIANDLRDGFPIGGRYDIGRTIGLFKTTMKYAEAGLAHCYVGNTSPEVYAHTPKQGYPRKFIVAPGKWVCKDRKSAHKEYPKRVGGICTDLWWYSICDLDAFKQAYPQADALQHFGVVRCRPGVYKFTHYYHKITDPEDPSAIYSEIKWLRKADPQRDYRAAYNALNYTAGQIVQDSLTRYPDLYRIDMEMRPVPLLSQIHRVTDHIFLTTGNGLDLHPNGWIGNNPDLSPHAPEVEIPVLHGRFRWYPASDYCLLSHLTGCGADIYKMDHGDYPLNESFQRLAYNIVQNILRYGGEEIHRKGEANLKKWAKRWLAGLRERYPEPDFCKGL